MELLNLDGVIEKGVFEIPSYQRGYAWQKGQLEDFWNDLEHVSKLGDKFHYMHSLTLRGLENEFEDSAFEIIDGQQRLATSLILLGLLAKTTQNKDPKYSLINLEPVLSYKYYGLSEAFRAIMEEEKDLKRFQTSSFYAKNLIDAHAFFQEKISDTPVGTLEKMFDALIKKMLFSVVELNDNRIDPFSSFETINNRGKDLSTLELLKNRLHFVAHKICDEEDEDLENLQQEINDTYTRIYHDLRSFEDDHLRDFLKHFVAYYYGEKRDFKERLLNTAFDAHKKYDDLYDEYKKINDLLLHLSYSSKVWYFLHTLDDEELRIEITPKMRGLLDKMRRLNALSENAFLPLLLSLLTIQLAVRSGSERHYTTKELEGLLEYLERFGFLIYGVADGKNTAKNEWIGLAFKAIQACRFWGDKITIEDLPTLEKSFFNRQGNSALELLEESIHSKKNTEKWYQWGKALNYLLYEYELYHNPETTLNFDDSIESIEHILPQKPDQGYSAKEKSWAKNPHIAHALGNLLLIPKNANSSLSNKPFEEKRKEYLKGSYSEKEVAKNASFGVVQIKERSEKLLDFLIAHYRIAELVGESEIKAFKNALLKDIE
ncbi:DUF262 domain-containing protein [Helicobacter pylori]